MLKFSDEMTAIQREKQIYGIVLQYSRPTQYLLHCFHSHSSILYVFTHSLPFILIIYPLYLYTFIAFHSHSSILYVFTHSLPFILTHLSCMSLHIHCQSFYFSSFEIVNGIIESWKVFPQGSKPGLIDYREYWFFFLLE